ncbi:PREDICTED: CWF19-like protein 2 isoform X2 [Atta colombica]|uniref:CWF19-like protein 2 isoform X2 n=1 Tax=Atta colombica TaxID=520822 RepID=UPI00084CC01F|nr:PREDICTED: CWF19-like protein 2 isoform X2 [Atta colombica]
MIYAIRAAFLQECTFFFQQEKIDKLKYSNEDIDSFVHRKSSKKFKSKKKKDKRGNKKHKKKRKYSSSSSKSDDSAKFEWVERKAEDQVVDCRVQENQIKREEWMNVESFIPYLSKPNVKLQELKEKDKEIFLNKPGQSNRELNPYWKAGGDGLPQNNPDRFDNPKILDVNWLKKSLRRVEEQALRDNKCLEEVAAERWGSLETIQTMIVEAERMSNTQQNKSYHKSCYNDKNDRDSHRISNPRIRKRSKSRSRSKDCAGKYNTLDYSLQHHTELKRTYRKPKDNDNYYQQTLPVNSSRIKNWKKDKSSEKRYLITELPVSEPKINLWNINSTNGIDKGVGVLTDAEINKLAELAAQLKIQLEHTRKHVTSCNIKVQEENVILTRTDAKGTARPIQPRNQSKWENYRNKKTAETHISGERVRHFADDDKYSLQEMFQREKGRSTIEDEAIFAKLASKNIEHMDDTFERQIARTDSEARQDKWDRAQAIKEHKNLSKCMDNCSWCLDSKNMLKHMVVTMDSVICLSLPACTSLSTGHCILTPVQHVPCQLQLDEDVWDRLMEFKRKLTKMFTDEDFYPIFFEMYKTHSKFSHMQLECIPLPKKIGELSPIYFKKALLECETEWSMNKKIIDLRGKGIRHAIPNGLSYFMVEFASHPGYAHVIEDEEMFPQNFAKEIIGGMLDLNHNFWRKPKRQSFEEQRIKVLEFTKKWSNYKSS